MEGAAAIPVVDAADDLAVAVEGDGGQGAYFVAEEGGGVHEFDGGASRVADDAQRIGDRGGRTAWQVRGEEVAECLPAGEDGAQAGVRVHSVRLGEIRHHPGRVVLAFGGEEAAEDRGDLGRAVRGVGDLDRVGQSSGPAGRRGRL